MPYYFEGYKRITHKFNEGWKDLDQQEYIGRFKQLGIKAGGVHYTDDEGSTDMKLTFVAPKGVNAEDAIEVIRNELSYGCRCEHDCCGHMQSYGRDIKRVKGRIFTAVLHRYPNI